MENLDINNAITTLNTVYFFKCALKQGYTQTALESILIHYFNISRDNATQLIYAAAPHYHRTATKDTCVDFLIRYVHNALMH